MEQVDITPVQPPSVTNYKISSLTITPSVIDITLADNAGGTVTHTYADQAMVQALNTANLSVKSLNRRLMERMIADGKIAGTISGTP